MAFSTLFQGALHCRAKDHTKRLRDAELAVARRIRGPPAELIRLRSCSVARFERVEVTDLLRRSTLHRAGCLSAFVAEVKSTTDDNVEHQLRLGLGQVLWYRQRLSGKHVRVVAVLVPETPPVDDEWLKLCEKLGVLIAWLKAFDRLL